MTGSPPLLAIEDLRIDLPTRDGMRPVIHRVDLTVPAGTAVGLVGESGSGKSMTARAVLRLLPAAARATGTVRLDDRDVATLGTAQLRALRGREVAMIFQDPRAHINPVRTVGDFLTEALITTRGVRPGVAETTVTALLRDVGIADAARRMRQRPPELSGGLLQRVMIAAALAAEPRLLIADEPTTALDVTTQAEVMAIIDEARAERGLAMLFITHDLALAAAVCDRIAVMYAGGVVEELPAGHLHEQARHPYTRALLASRPDPTATAQPLRAVPGRPLSASEAGPGCAFAPRCPHVQDVCGTERPAPRPAGDGSAACHFPADIRTAVHEGDRSTAHD
ncbi:ABC transporter ATP-binding protein [Streptomyces phaeoluteigriseus]|uniref:ABC transporter ATP-binding protein n=1 Tax=Streptomyces phaeoluteigriseus TaxID=114686 RepID=A0ABY4ZBX4_9ACTN|nr:ABC transporter ATP-binding protein [Streptomyces phaeoluteigriseus]USQ86402.1 ABC transporter ATP-binding protein [Streptomyces phaeoluteigriseus]